MSAPESIVVDGIEYVKKDAQAATLDGLKYVMCRTFSAGVFAGYLESRNDKGVVLRNARRIYYWDGAATLSQLATDGTSKPKNCKFPCAVDRVELMEAIEIIGISKKAQDSIAEVVVWEM
jgi:hypothetical protein